MSSHVSTPYASAVRLLQLARAGKEDALIDLGSGDGTIPTLAALVFGVRKAWGIELDAEMVDRSREFANALALSEERVEFLCGDMFALDLRGFDVVTVFQSQDAIERLLGKLIVGLDAGARVVSYLLPLGGMSPLRLVRPSRVEHPFYVYKAPLEYLSEEESVKLLREISGFAEGAESEWAKVAASVRR